MLAHLALLSVRAAVAGTLLVDPAGGGDFTSIQQAIDAAADGDRIEVLAGAYPESLQLGARDLELVGAGTGKVSVGAPGAAAALSFVGGASVSVEELTLTASDRGVDQAGGTLALRAVELSGFADGAIAVLQGRLELSEALLSENSAARGGAIQASESELVLSDLTVEGNTASVAGGAVHASESAVTALRVTWSGNESGGEGGAMALYGGSLACTAGPLSGNSAASGGAISADAAVVTLDGCDLSGNSAATGAALRASGGGPAVVELTLSGLAVTGNDASGGSVVALDGLSGALLSDVTLSDNLGVGLSAGDTPITLRDVSARGNATGLRLDGAPSASLTRVRVSENDDGLVLASLGEARVTNLVAVANGGAGVLASGDHGYLLLENADLADNERGLYVTGGSGVEVVNVNAVDNEAAGFAGPAEALAIRYSNAWGNGRDWGELGDLAGSEGNLSGDPLWVGYEADGVDEDDFGLGAGSPCRDAGDPELEDADGSRSDVGSYGGSGAEVSDDDGDGYAEATGDCDDGDASVHPGAEETWYDGIDGDCDGADDDDADGDGYPADGSDPADCDDADPDTYPGADDASGDGKDTNCDGEDGVVSAASEDRDGDGFTEDDGDCNDWDRQIHPDAPEACGSNIDNDCDGELDRNEPTCATEVGCGGCGGAGGGPLALVALLALAGRRRDSACGPS